MQRTYILPETDALNLHIEKQTDAANLYTPTLINQ